MRRLGALGVVAVIAAFAAMPASATVADEEALAAKFAPVLRLVQQQEECGPGEPYGPTDVDVLFDEPTVALRGPWNAVDLVAIAPSADDLANLYEYHLDYPGNPLKPGCDYERWARQITTGSTPTVYAHVATEAGRPGKLALQYWVFYPFNEFNNLHEGDWEMIQLVFDARDAGEALERSPARIGYSSHEGAEGSDWDDSKLERVDDTHPVVYVSEGSHANKYTAALYLGSSADQGVGCDDTQGPHDEVRPAVRTIPSDPEAARRDFPWIAFEGRWGELQEAFYNGPTGPNLKRQWTEPISWSEEWRARSYAVPAGGILGTSATDFFCDAVGAGSSWLTNLLDDPLPLLLATAVLLGLLVLVVVRATWTPVAPLRIARRRTWGQTLSSSARMYVNRFPLFVGIGLLAIPTSVVVAVLQVGVVGLADSLGVDTTGESSSVLAYLVFLIGMTLALVVLGLVLAAVTCALLEMDAGRPVGPVTAYRLALRRFRPLLRAIAFFVAVWIALTSTLFLVPVAIWLAVRWSLLVQVVEIEERSTWQTIRRSGRLVQGRWLHVASLVGAGSVLALLAGPFLGALLIIVTSAPFALLNLVAGVVYMLTLPFTALVTAYVYFDARARAELEPETRPSELPAEYELTS
ncbi:MAG TPA: hypothetical protein VLA22_01390 [Gaiellaceae bacterium]|nr:hypothetical protein [Gaiellaceae bacterium]